MARKQPKQPDGSHQYTVERNILFEDGAFNRDAYPRMGLHLIGENPALALNGDVSKGLDFHVRLLEDRLNKNDETVIDIKDVIINENIQNLGIYCKRSNYDGSVDIFYYRIKHIKNGELTRFALMPEPQHTRTYYSKEELSDLAQKVKDMALSNRQHQTATIDRLKPILNDYVKALPQASLDEKKKLGRWITAELAQYGLAVECPNTPGLAVEVKGDAGNRPGIGRFQFLPLEGDGGVRKQRVYRDVLPELSFVTITNSVDLSPRALPDPPQSGHGKG